MKEIIGDLKALPGVLGACLFHGQKGVLVSNMPTIFSAEKQEEIGKILIKIQTAGRMNFHDLTDLSLQYDEAVILVRELEKNLTIFVLADPEFNQNLVTMSLNILQQELKNKTVTLTESKGVEEVPAVETSQSEKVAPVLAAMKSHLPKIMGPMAEIIFDETVEAWQQQTKCSVNDLGSLVQLLNEEIGHPDKISSFQEMIEPALKKAAGGGK